MLVRAFFHQQRFYLKAVFYQEKGTMVTLLKNRARIYRRHSGHFSAHRTFSRLLESFLLIVPKKLLLKTFFKQNSDLATSEAATSKTILALARDAFQCCCLRPLAYLSILRLL